MAHDSFDFCLFGEGRKSNGKNVRHCVGQIILLPSDRVGTGEKGGLRKAFVECLALKMRAVRL